MLKLEKEYKMKYWLNPEKEEFNFDKIRQNLWNCNVDEKYSQEPVMNNVHDFEQENPFVFEVDDLDDKKKKIRLNVYYQKHTKGKKAKGIVLMNHGFNSHIQRFKQMGQFLAQEGLDVWGFDTRGFGKSEGYKGYMHYGIDYHIQDNLQFYSLIDKYYQDSSLPRFGLGVSFGGLIAIHTAIAHPTYLKAIILLAPALQQVATQAKLLKTILPVVAFCSGRYNLPINQKANNATKNPLAVQENLKDHLMFTPTKPKSISNVLNTIKHQAFRKVDQLITPFLLVHGTADKLVDLEGAFHLKQKTINCKEKHLLVVDNLWHAVPLENEIYEIEDIIATWLKPKLK